MKKLLLLIMLTLCVTNLNAQSFTRTGNTFTSVTKDRTKSEPVKTKFTWKDSKGKEYPIYISSTGSCYILKTSSKTGKEYRNYLDTELSAQICKELGIEYKTKKNKRND